MKVLIVLAFKNERKAKASPCESLAERFVRLVGRVFSASPSPDRLEIITRRVNQLAEYLPPLPARGVPANEELVRQHIAALDGIDLVFLDGDDSLKAWKRQALPLLQLLQLCALGNKCVFGCSCTVQLLAYLAMVGCRPTPLLDGNTILKDDAHHGSARSEGRSALLERQTGDLFQYNNSRSAWEPVSNVGVHSKLGPPAASGSLGDGLNRSNGIGLCEVSTLARFHFLFREVWPVTFHVSQSNEWHCHLRPGQLLRLPTGDRELRVLATSRLGQQVLECGNIVALQFRPDPRYPNTLRMLQNFVAEKMKLLLGDADAAKGYPQPGRILSSGARFESSRVDMLQQILTSLAPSDPTAANAPQRSRSPSQPHAAPPPPADEAARRAASAGGEAAAKRPARSWSAGPRGRSAASAVSSFSRASIGTAPATVRQGSLAGVAISQKDSGKQISYQLPPERALAYLTASGGALTRAAENVHMAHATKAYAEVCGQGDVPIYVSMPLQKSHRPGSARPRVVSTFTSQASTSTHPQSAMSATESETHSQADESELKIEAFEDAPEEKPPQPTPRVVKIKPKPSHPYSNYQKYIAARKAFEKQSVHVTSVGPYVSKLDQMNMDERKAVDKSRTIHEQTFVPGGITHHPMDECTGFAAAGFNLPPDLPPTAQRFGTFYNTHLHNFRHTTPKTNLYM